MVTAAAGWFPDPRGASATYRWWDGGTWTPWLSDDEHAPAPAADPAAADAGVAQAVRTPVAVVVLIAALVLALVAVGVTVSFTNQKVIVGPAVDPPPAPPAPVTIIYDRATRTVQAEKVLLTLPGTPFDCNQVASPPSYFRKAVICSTVVHRDYVKGESTYNNLAVGLVDESLVRADVRTTGEAVFLSIRHSLYSREPGRLSKFTSGPTTYGSPDRVLIFNGQVDYQVKGLPSRFDTLVMVAVKLDDGSYAVVFANQADDTAKATRTALTTALETFALR